MHRFHVRVALTVAAAALALAACGSSSKPASSRGDADYRGADHGGTDHNRSGRGEGNGHGRDERDDRQEDPRRQQRDDPVRVGQRQDRGHVELHRSVRGRVAAAQGDWDTDIRRGLTASMFSTITGDQLAVNGKPAVPVERRHEGRRREGARIGGFYVVGVDGNKVDSD